MLWRGQLPPHPHPSDNQSECTGTSHDRPRLLSDQCRVRPRDLPVDYRDYPGNQTSEGGPLCTPIRGLDSPPSDTERDMMRRLCSADRSPERFICPKRESTDYG